MDGFIIDFWHWWVLAVVLLIIEMLAPTFFALWLSIAAGIMGIIVYISPDMLWEYQAFIFSLLAVGSSVLWRYYYIKRPIATDQPRLNRRGEQYLGRTVTLKAPIEDGSGKIKLDDSIWKIEGENCPAGTKVKIISIDNIIFKVEHVD